jgi:endonuclease/exonuclease/phosphatase family metal-dependent hydrolase
VRVISWNMGCAPRPAKYRKTHAEAWRYLLDDLKPDVALIQEALVNPEPIAREYGQMFWSADKGTDSGTAVLVRGGLAGEFKELRSAGSYVAAAEVTINDSTAFVASIHVGPPRYRKHLRTLMDVLVPAVAGQRFIVGGDLNAARHVDNVYGGRWFHRFFESVAAREFHDCHWQLHGKEVQSFWGRQARNPYQCDHVFVDRETAHGIRECHVIDNPVVRALSDHGPLLLRLADTSAA